MRLLVFVGLLLQVVFVFSVVLQTEDGFLFTSNYEFFDGFGVSLGLGKNLLGFGVSYSDSGYVEKTVQSGFLKMKLKTEWESFKVEAVVGNGWGISVSYREKILVPFPSNSHFRIFLGSGDFLKFQDSYSSFNAMGLKFLSRSLDIYFNGFRGSFSLRSAGYLNASLGLVSFGSSNILGFYVPVGRWDRGVLIGGWLSDTLKMGLAGRSLVDLGSTDLEVLWGTIFGRENIDFFTGFGFEIGRSKLLAFFSSTGWGILVHE